MAEALSSEAIGAAIDAAGGTRIVGRSVEIVEETASTNDLALAAGERGEADGWTVFAERQTAGRGRRGDPWLSPARRDLLFSILLRPPQALEAWPRLPQLAAVALCRAIDALGPALRVAAEIKWPNDVWLDGRKVAGLLVDTRQARGSAFAVLGIGLNVNSEAFPPELEAIATSLRLAAGGRPDFDRSRLAARILVELDRVYPRCLDAEAFGEILDGLRRRSCLLEQRVEVVVAGVRRQGTVIDFGPWGEMLLRGDDGQVETIHSADQVRLA